MSNPRCAWLAVLGAPLLFVVVWAALARLAAGHEPKQGEAPQPAPSAAAKATQASKPMPHPPQPVRSAEPGRDFELATVHGKVVWLAEALRERWGIRMVPEAAQRILALETAAGDLLPILEDLRGRAFRTDQRLRGRPLELRVRRYRDVPMLQIVGVYEIQEGKKYELDYWCDVCSIRMFEKGLCSCCQAPNRLRRTLVAGPAE